jgi:hypothetical protein
VIESLLEKRNAIYSDRPGMAVLTKWWVFNLKSALNPLQFYNFFRCGCDWFMTALPYGEEFHTQRRMINRFLSANGVRSYHELIREQVMKLVRRTAQDSSQFQAHNLQ